MTTFYWASTTTTTPAATIGYRRFHGRAQYIWVQCGKEGKADDNRNCRGDYGDGYDPEGVTCVYTSLYGCIYNLLAVFYTSQTSHLKSCVRFVFRNGASKLIFVLFFKGPSSGKWSILFHSMFILSIHVEMDFPPGTFFSWTPSICNYLPSYALPFPL